MTHLCVVPQLSPVLVLVGVAFVWAEQHFGRHVVERAHARHRALRELVDGEPEVRNLPM